MAVTTQLDPTLFYDEPEPRPIEYTLISVVDEPEDVVAVIREAHDGQGLIG